MPKILVIEDDPTVQALIQKLLKAEGFDVVVASDGFEGIQYAQDQSLDLIISDIMMPGCDGYEVLEQLHQNPDTTNIPFIFLTAKSDRRDLRQGMELGADDYLTKPFTRAELLGAIAARLEKQKNITEPYVQEMKRAANSISQLAYQDPLTELPNRILLHQRLQEALGQARRSQYSVALICINLDRFKSINDNLGYSAGDSLLQAVAQRLLQFFADQGIVARLGGDEFSVVLPQCHSRKEVANIVAKALNQLQDPYQVHDQYIHVQLSMGIAVYPEHGTNLEQLLQHADVAMRSAKQQNQGKYQFYDAEMSALMAERRSLEGYLNGALERGELYVQYQPQVNLITGRIIGVEALLRWRHPELGEVDPSKFIPIAEETGLIKPIGEWVLQTACSQACNWQRIGRMSVRVSVNISARQFKQQNLGAIVNRVLQETQLNPELLVLEMTETSIMEDVDKTIEILQELRSMGVNISIDDFGTGYSSLNYLKRFPLDTLKIDQAFVQDVDTDTNDAAIVKAILAMAHSLQLKVIAEGVETQEQVSFLRQNGCYSIQGFLFSQPISAAEFEEMLMLDKRL